jgi:hypothetical protein
MSLTFSKIFLYRPGVPAKFEHAIPIGIFKHESMMPPNTSPNSCFRNEYFGNHLVIANVERKRSKNEYKELK